MNKLSVLSSRNSDSKVKKNILFGLGLFLMLLIYDGALRKWVLPGAEQLIFIAKDALVFGLLVYAMLNRPRQINSSMHPVTRALFVLYAAWVLLESVNLNLPSILVGIWGLKAHLLYASLILLLPLAYSNLDDLYRWLVKVYPWIVIPVCALAFVQLTAPADSFINHQVTGGMDMISYFGDARLVRVTGTFSYITGMAEFLKVTSVLGVGIFLSGVRSRLFLIGLAFALAALPATGSRSVIAITASSALIMLFAALASRLISSRMLLRIVVVVIVLGAVSLQTQDETWSALQQRTTSVAEHEDDSYRVFTAFTNAFRYFDVSGFVGFGSGSANFGSVALAKGVAPFSWLPVGGNFEEESGRIVLELGMFGWMISLVMRITFFFWAGILSLKGQTRNVRVAGVMALPIMALSIQLGNGIFSPPVGAVYYWFCVALLSMAQYEHREALAKQTRLRWQQFQAVVR